MISRLLTRCGSVMSPVMSSTRAIKRISSLLIFRLPTRCVPVMFFSSLCTNTITICYSRLCSFICFLHRTSWNSWSCLLWLLVSCRCWFWNSFFLHCYTLWFFFSSASIVTKYRIWNLESLCWICTV